MAPLRSATWVSAGAIALFLNVLLPTRIAVFVAQQEGADHHRRAVSLGQYAYAWGGKINCSALQAELVATHTTSYSFLLEDQDGSSYLSAVECLAQTVGLTVDGVPFTAWFTLIPPAEGALGSCSVPADSPLTHWNETALFNMSLGRQGCYDYLAWAQVVGRLSGQFDHLRFLNVDDFSDADNERYFSPESSRRMVDLLRPNAQLVPTLYFNSRSSIVDRNLSVDGALFYFRNEKEGIGPCAVSAGCPINCTGQWPGAAGCLTGRCAEPTASSVRGEIAEVRASLPEHAVLHVGLYISGAVQPESCPQWDCSTPSALYAQLVLEAALATPAVDGIMVFAMAKETNALKRNVVASVFGRFTRDCPTPVPFGFRSASGGTTCCDTTTWFNRGDIVSASCDGNQACCLDGLCGDLQSCAELCPVTRPYQYVNGTTKLCCEVDTGLRPTGAKATTKCPTGFCCVSQSCASGIPRCADTTNHSVPECSPRMPFAYGDSTTGVYCCAQRPTNGSTCPSGACCLTPGTVDGCQDERPCAAKKP